MTRASQQKKALQDIRRHASDEELKRRYGYSPEVIAAMRETVSCELHQQADNLDLDMEGPAF